MVDTFGTGIVPDEKIAEAVNKIFDLRPAAIIKNLDLRNQFIKNYLLMVIWAGKNLVFYGKRPIKPNN